MGFGAIVLLAIGLAMDATAVAAARGLAAREVTLRHTVIVAGAFGGAQGLMPLFGYWLGQLLGPLVMAWDHWIAFVLLVGLGLKMLHEARKKSDDPEEGDLFGAKVMLVLAIATSIDAFAVGITLPMLEAPLLLSVITIGVVTAALSAVGLHAGRRFGAMLGPRLDALGGIVLIGLGVKILVEHLTAS